MSFKNPFYCIEEFVSPLACEDIIDMCNFTVPDTDKEMHPIKTTRPCEKAEHMIYEQLMQHMPKIEQYYNVQYKGTERMMFEWYPPGSVGDFICENSQKLRDKWVRTKARDFTAILFLSDFQDKPNFDQDYEVYGGRLEFIHHQFSFKPQRGELILFPSDPYFINITTEVLAGDAFQVRLQLAVNGGFKYKPTDFPGNYTVWF